MSTTISSPQRTEIIYPDSDGQPMANNTLQFEWIVTIKGGLEALFRDNPDVFVAGDLLWYPVKGEPKIRIAPDALVAFGRPKGYRGSYKQWEEGGIAPQVVFEVLSPGNFLREMIQKFRFYEKYGVEEYYIYDPDHGNLDGWRRGGPHLEEIAEMNGFTSPLLGIRFQPGEGANNLQIIRPDGRPFATYLELFDEQDSQRLRAEAESRRAEAESRRAEAESRRAEAESRRADRLAAMLREMGIEPE